MANIKKDIKRVPRGSSVDPKIWERLKAYSGKTGVPMSKILDRALEEFLDQRDK